MQEVYHRNNEPFVPQLVLKVKRNVRNYNGTIRSRPNGTLVTGSKQWVPTKKAQLFLLFLTH